MRGRPCSICQLNDPAIDAALTAGGALIPTAKRFGCSKSALQRHRLNCLAPRAAAAARLVQGTRATREPTIRAAAIASGAAPTPAEVLSLTSLLDRLARSLDRLEGSAQVASQDGLHSALAALSGQISRSVEVAARMQSIGYKDAQAAAQNERFSITISLPEGTAPTRHAIVDCTPEGREHGSESEPSDTVPQAPARGSFAIGFDLRQNEDQE